MICGSLTRSIQTQYYCEYIGLWLIDNRPILIRLLDHTESLQSLAVCTQPVIGCKPLLMGLHYGVKLLILIGKLIFPNDCGVRTEVESREVPRHAPGVNIGPCRTHQPRTPRKLFERKLHTGLIYLMGNVETIRRRPLTMPGLVYT